VIDPELKQKIQSLCPKSSQDLLEAFFANMDTDYFATFPPKAVANHIQMASALSDEKLVQLRITPQGKSEFDIAIVGFDYLAQFSIFCGLLSAFGLDIRTGDIFSYSKRSPSSKVVDVFRVAVKPGEVFDQNKEVEFEDELQTAAHLLAQNSIQEARMRLYQFLTEHIERMDQPLSGLLSPVTLTFDNETSTDWTVMEVQSEDTFAFLYAVSNALSMRGIYISRVKIRSAEHQTHDQFFIVDRWGKKIRKPSEQKRLTLAVRMIKQFTRFITEAPDPAKAMQHFDQFLDKLEEIEDDKLLKRTLSLLDNADRMRRLAQLLGSSDYLWDSFLQIHFAELIPMIEADSKPSNKETMQRELRTALDQSAEDGQREILNAYKDRQLFLIDVEHLLQPNATLLDFSRSLTDLGEVVVGEAARMAYERLAETNRKSTKRKSPGVFAIFGLGKFGGREMGYASDLELIFVHEGDSEFFSALAHQVVDFIETRDKGIFHIDLRLRPHGDAGAWSTSYEQFTKYYSIDGGAAPFERQALIRLRWCAGDENLGRRVEAHRDSFTYGGQAWDWQDALHLRQRQMKELVKPGDVNVKYSAGGIIDIEYAVQYLQLLNGREHPAIRVPTTLEALGHLRRLQIVRETDYRLLHSSYLFLRNVIDALRIVRGDASDLVLPNKDTDEFKSLARRMGYREKDRVKSAAHLSADIQEFMEGAHAYFLTRFESQG
jgi:[glutamine synthetase] adenylyltransferase / [glutamine synthetase]-adenylyl-L-tyrosine phosphorylase